MYPSITALRRDVSRRVRRGEHVVLYGPWGSGKTTLLQRLEDRLKEAGIPCGRSEFTHCVDDIRGALEAIHPTVRTAAGDEQGAPVAPSTVPSSPTTKGVLLLDHLTDVSNAMAKFLKRLRGGPFGVLIVVDQELEDARRRLRPWRLGSLAVRMPPESADRLSELLEAGRLENGLPSLKGDFESQLIRAAQGRPGWIVRCIELARNKRYWQGDQLFVSMLCEDTDVALYRAAANALGLDERADNGFP